MPTNSLPPAITSCSENPACSTNTGSNSATRLSESGFIGQQLAAHACPLRPAPGVDEHRARRSRALVRAHHTGGVLAGGQRTQPGHRLGAFAGHHGAEFGLPGAVMVDGVGHIGQGHPGAGALHPIGQHRRRRRYPLRRLARHHQRRHLSVGAAQL